MMHALRSFSEDPIITGPLVCHLCEDATFVYDADADFAAHKQKVHSGENEYRKRVLFLMEQSGSRLITGHEKRITVQHYVHFQQYARPGAKGNTFAGVPEEPRCEAACVLCQRKDFIEHRPAGCSPRVTARCPETRRQGVTEKVWKGRGWRREGAEQGGWSEEEVAGSQEEGGREKDSGWRGPPEARRQGFGFEEGLLLSRFAPA